MVSQFIPKLELPGFAREEFYKEEHFFKYYFFKRKFFSVCNHDIRTLSFVYLREKAR